MTSDALGKILITGSQGFCARHLSRYLLSQRAPKLHATDRLPEPDCSSSQIIYHPVDLTDESQVNELISYVRPNTVFHLAALNSGTPSALYRVNTVGSANLFQALASFAAEVRVLAVGSAAEYGPVDSSLAPINEDQPCVPVTPYGISKHAMTLTAKYYFQRYGLKVVIARPFNIIGAGVPSCLVVGAILDRVKEALESNKDMPTISVGNLDSSRDFIAVQDVIWAYVKLVEGNYWGQVFNICSGQRTRIRDLLEPLIARADRPVAMRQDPRLMRSGEVTSVYGDFSKASRAFGFRPTVSLVTSLAEAWDAVLGEDATS